MIIIFSTYSIKTVNKKKSKCMATQQFTEAKNVHEHCNSSQIINPKQDGITKKNKCDNCGKKIHVYSKHMLW